MQDASERACGINHFIISVYGKKQETETCVLFLITINLSKCIQNRNDITSQLLFVVKTKSYTDSRVHFIKIRIRQGKYGGTWWLIDIQDVKLQVYSVVLQDNKKA